MGIEQTYYIVWLVDVDWMHLEVGLKWACCLRRNLCMGFPSYFQMT